jgi:hypothetical protein
MKIEHVTVTVKYFFDHVLTRLSKFAIILVDGVVKWLKNYSF